MQIIPGLYVGDDDAYQRLKDRPGWSFLRCCKEGPGGHRQTLGYTTLGAPKDKNYLWVKRGNHMALNLLDLDDPEFIAEGMINMGLDFIRERLAAGDKVLIACNQGHSRGPTTALMYLRTVGEMPYAFTKAERVFRTLYPKYDPGQAMRQYARSHWRQLEEQHG